MAVAPSLEKYTGDSRVYGFDYSREPEFRSGGDTIASATITADVVGLTIGTPAIDNTTHIVSAVISSGTSGTQYVLTCTATTTSGVIIVHQGLMKVL